MNFKTIFTTASKLIIRNSHDKVAPSLQLTGFGKILLRVSLTLAFIVGLNAISLTLIYRALNPTYTLPDEYIVTLNLAGLPEDTPAKPSAVEAFLREQGLIKHRPITYLEIIRAIHKINSTPEVKGVLILNDPGDGLIQANDYELKQALDSIKKPVWYYSKGADQRTLYVTANATEKIIHPFGSVFVGGFNISQPYFKDLLDKVGVNVQVIKAGKYKSAVEPFLMNKMSEENNVQLKAIIDTSWNNLSFSYSPDTQKQNSFNLLAKTKPVLSAQDAVKNKFFGKTATIPELRALIKDSFFTAKDQLPSRADEVNVDHIEDNLVSMTKFVLANQKEEIEDEPYVAVVYLSGSINEGPSKEGTIGSSTVLRQLDALKNDDLVKAVVLRINSPGGSATASEYIANALEDLQKKKPVYTSMGKYAASGGYWIASATEKAYAAPTTLTGSIGVFGLLPDFSGVLNKVGVTFNTVQTHPYANLTSMIEAKTPVELKLYQTEVDKIYSTFLNRVSKFRTITYQKVDSLAQGRVWTGQDALANELVDGILTLDEVLSLVSSKSNTSHYKEFYYYPSFSESLQLPNTFTSKVKSLVDSRVVLFDPISAFTFTDWEHEIATEIKSSYFSDFVRLLNRDFSIGL